MVNLWIHSYSGGKLTIRMVHVHIVLIGRQARFSVAVCHMLATFPPLLIPFLSFTLSMITQNWCVINSGMYRVEHFTGVETM